VVPNVNQCAACHVADIKSRQFQPIGPKARHLNRDYSYEA
jgi:cytochrome c553